MPDRPRLAVDLHRREHTVDTAGTLRCLRQITSNVGSTSSVVAAPCPRQGRHWG